MQTNASITFYKKTRDWKQAIGTPTNLGTFDVWLEFGTQIKWRSVGGQGLKEEVGKGMIFLQDDIDLTDAYFTYSGEQYEVTAVDGRFPDRQQTFHHQEAIFK